MTIEKTVFTAQSKESRLYPDRWHLFSTAELKMCKMRFSWGAQYGPLGYEEEENAKQMLNEINRVLKYREEEGVPE